MTHSTHPVCAHVIYRATSSAGEDLEIHLAIEPEAATVADAWSRLTRICAHVDPMSLEIEVRSDASSLRPRSGRARAVSGR